MQNVLPALGIGAYVVTLIALALVNLVYGPGIPTPKVPMQWSLGGEPTWYADKWIGLWIPVAIFVGVGALLLFKARTTVPAMMSDYVWLIACCVFFVGVHGWHVSKVIEWSQRQL
ncbi:MAG: DUF1648 domain-containing protein [Methylorubrum rhodinum]|uniref:hypothetical protein n=1 Tax=Methylorubrum rhodinum TaxID=29428 RepID=UPI003BB09055